MIRPNAHVADLAPYALADLAARPGQTLISLSQNESIRPPSPRAVKAAARALEQAALYPDPGWADLRAGLSALHGIPGDGILCGAGSLDLIAALMRTYAGPDRAVLAPAHAYPFFRTAAAMAGARFETAPEIDWTVNVDALLGAVGPQTHMVCVANPANPTGTRVTVSELERLRCGLPDHVLLVIDEAYGEFSDGLDTSCWPLTDDHNCVVLRTFSKAYGLAGMRVGWGLFPAQITRDVGKLLNPNGVGAPAQAAAIAALDDQAYMRETCALTERARLRYAAACEGAGIDVIPSHTNFLLLDLGAQERAADLCRFMAARGIILRSQQGAGAPQAVRITLGDDDKTELVLSALAAWQTGHRA